MSDTSRSDTLLLRQATERLRSDTGVQSEWLTGYVRGLRRAIHGEAFGTDDEHTKWLAFSGSANPTHAERGAGYRAGLAREPLDAVTGSTASDADRLRAWLTEHRRTQRGLARELDVDERTVRYWCSGQQPVPRVVWLALERLASDKSAI